MALTVKHLNSDASFLLSFEPVYTDPTRGSVVVPQPFTILLDPWITGPSKIFHSRFSVTTHKTPPCVSSLSELPEPDLVIISQHKSDHCNEATLRQLPAFGTKTLILAEPASARLIRSWKYFDRDKIRTIEPWKDRRAAGKSTILRVPVPPVTPGGQGGEITVSWIPQKRDIAGLHGAIGITYRPPPSYSLSKLAAMSPRSDLLTPPATPVSIKMPAAVPLSASTIDVNHLPSSPPISPRSLRSVQSASTLIPSPVRGTYPTRSLSRCLPSRSRTTSMAHGTRPISLLFSPHGISFAHIGPWATSHLVSEAALPLTALLHCMDSITNPWWLGGNICSGTLTGADIANKLGARVWVSAHDAEKEVKGIGTGLLKTRKWEREEIVGIVSPGITNGKTGIENGAKKENLGLGMGMDKGTEVLRLESGEEVLVTGEGMVLAASGKAKGKVE
ncbi:lactamase domain-containing protein [Seiridium cupressi]